MAEFEASEKIKKILGKQKVYALENAIIKVAGEWILEIAVEKNFSEQITENCKTANHRDERNWWDRKDVLVILFDMEVNHMDLEELLKVGNLTK